VGEQRTPWDEHESEREQLDRQLDQLLQELRIAMPGVQVLFAFLLTVPFNQRFAEVTGFQKNVYLVTLLCSALASAFFIAPTAYHRIMFRHRDKPELVRTATRFAVVGLTLLALAMTGAVLLVVDFLFEGATVVVAVAIVALAFAFLWFGLPLARRLTGKRSH